MAKLFGLIAVATLTLTFAGTNGENPSNHLEFVDELDPVLAEQIAGELAADPEATVDREKRLILLKKIGLKAGLLDFVFGKIDSFLDSKTRLINELDKQNIVKNQKYFGITPPPPRPNYKNTLVGTLLTAKKNLIGSAFSSLISSKLGHASGSLGFGSLGSLSGGGGAGVSAGTGSSGASFGAGGSSSSGASFSAGASLPGVGSASVGSSVSLPSFDASFAAGAGLGGQQALYGFRGGYY